MSHGRVSSRPRIIAHSQAITQPFPYLFFSHFAEGSIAGERVAFETIFTLMLPPHSKGVPDLKISEMREPFDTLVPERKPIDEDLGAALAVWSKGGAPRSQAPAATAPKPAAAGGAPVEGAGPAGSRRGQKLGDALTRLQDVADRNQRAVSVMLRLITQEWGTAERTNLSDFSDEELDKILAIPDTVLKSLAAQAKTWNG